MNDVCICIIEDEDVTIAADLFAGDGKLNEQPSKAFDFRLSKELFVLDPRSGHVRVKKFHNEVSYQKVLDVCLSTDQFSLIFLDLQWDFDLGNCEIFKEHLKAALNSLREAEKNAASDLGNEEADLFREAIDRRFYGIILAHHLLSIDSWQGLLCLASGRAHVPTVESFLSSCAPRCNSERFYEYLKGPVRSTPKHFQTGICKFLEIFGPDGLIRWWLHPPGDVQNWFEGVRHNPGADDTDYKAVQRRFGDSSLWTDDFGRYSKTVFRVPEVGEERVRSLLNKPLPVPAEVIRMVLGGTVEVVEDLRGKVVSLPCMPALPFLFAVKTAFDCAHEETGENSSIPVPDCCLKQLDSNRFGFVMKQKRDASELVRLVNQSTVLPSDRRIGNCERSFRNALRASVDCPQDLADRPLASFLGGFSEPIAELEWSKEENELRVTWPAKQSAKNKK